MIVKKKEAKRPQEYWSLEWKSVPAAASMVLMAASVICILVYRWGFWKNADSFTVVSQVLLPWLAASLYIAFLPLFGKTRLWTTCLPVLLGAAFFITKAATFDKWWHMLLCIVLYGAVLLLYFSTMVGLVKTKLPMAAVFGAVFVYHVLIADIGLIPALREPRAGVQWFLEAGVLCIILALFLLTASMRRAKPPLPPQDGK